MTPLSNVNLSKATPEQRAKIEELLALKNKVKQERPWTAYPYDPVGYAKNVLGLEYLTPDQEKILKSLHQPPFKTSVDSCNASGKSFISAVAICYWYDSFDPCAVICTAPSDKHIKDVLWSEVRLLRTKAKIQVPMDFIGPRAAEMRSSEEHWAQGLVAEKGEMFKGRHRPRMLFIFDEAEGLPQTYYDATRTMFKPDDGHAWLAIANPSTTSSPMYLESRKTNFDGTPTWKLLQISALRHPNVLAGLNGTKPPIPNAVSMRMVEDWVRDLCIEITPEENQVTDFTWRGKDFRPGAEAEVVILGRRPTQGTSGVWNEGLWGACENLSLKDLPFPLHKMPEIGCDVARVMGGDDCCIVAQWGGVILLFESANGRSIPATAARLKEVAGLVCELANKEIQHLIDDNKAKPFFPRKIPIKIDDGGVGGAVVDMAEDYRFIPVNSANTANMELKYPNVRSELWFQTVEMARMNGLSLAYLAEEDRQKLKIQALSPLWSMDARGRRVVEKKEITKDRLGRSPDGMDALNLACYMSGGAGAEWIGLTSSDRHDESMSYKTGIYGRKKGIEEQREDFDNGYYDSHSEAVKVLGRGLR